MATAAGSSINTGLDAPYEDNQEPEKELPEKTGSEESTSSDSESEGLGEELPERKDKGKEKIPFDGYTSEEEELLRRNKPVLWRMATPYEPAKGKKEVKQGRRKEQRKALLEQRELRKRRMSATPAALEGMLAPRTPRMEAATDQGSTNLQFAPDQFGYQRYPTQYQQFVPAQMPYLPGQYQVMPNPRIILTPLQKMPTFSGQEHENLNSFLAQFDHLAEQQQWSPVEQVVRIAPLLKGRAAVVQKWIEQKIAYGELPTLEEVKAELYAIYGPSLASERVQALQKLKELKQEDRELVAEYKIRMDTLLLILDGEMGEQMKIEYFKSGLKESLKKKVLTKLFVSYNDCVQRVLALEEEERANAQARPKQRGEKTGNNSSPKVNDHPKPKHAKIAKKKNSQHNQSKPVRTFQGECFKCGQPGHKKKDCPQAKSKEQQGKA